MDNQPTNVYTGNTTPEKPKRSGADTFWALFKQSVIMQAILSLMMVGAYIYLTVAGRPVTSEFYTLLGLVIGFFFGGKMGMAQGKEAAKAETATA